MRYSFRTLVILMMTAGPLSAWCWARYSAHLELKARAAEEIAFRKAHALAQAQLANVRLAAPIKPQPGRYSREELRQMIKEAIEIIEREGLENQPYTHSRIGADGEMVSITVTHHTDLSPRDFLARQQKQQKD